MLECVCVSVASHCYELSKQKKRANSSLKHSKEEIEKETVQISLVSTRNR